MSMRILAPLFASSLLLASLAAQAAGPVLSQISCTGKTSDGRTAQITIVVAPTATSYPAPAVATLNVGTASAESLNVTLTLTSGQDVSTKTVYLFDAALDATRAFGSRTFDQHTGVGALKLGGDLRAPMLNCTFNN